MTGMKNGSERNLSPEVEQALGDLAKRHNEILDKLAEQPAPADDDPIAELNRRLDLQVVFTETMVSVAKALTQAIHALDDRVRTLEAQK
ncbi:hypothetical protein AB0N05_38630 [Nocardia sp. NPDC051030]|uniref:hypothetical protein n=1 Tax=Nocardia sp. NPDC051030 TaxID=3155162 RepID=UPI003414D77F